MFNLSDSRWRVRRRDRRLKQLIKTKELHRLTHENIFSVTKPNKVVTYNLLLFYHKNRLIICLQSKRLRNIMFYVYKEDI